MEQLDRIIAEYVTLGQSNMQAIDAYGDITVQNFVDLLSAVHNDAVLDLLAQELCKLIHASQLDLSSYSGVVCPKNGNALLGHAVARKLEKKSGFIRSSILFGSYLETLEVSGAKLLLVDDVSSEASILTHSVRNAREAGFTIDAVFTLIDRAEGDAARRLASQGVSLQSVRRYSDRQLADLVSSRRSVGIR
jgi:orotate phosphoribosyltransferase